MIQGEVARRAGGDKEIFSFTSLKIPTQNLPKSSKIHHGFFAFSALPISGLFWKKSKQYYQIENKFENCEKMASKTGKYYAHIELKITNKCAEKYT